MIDNTKILQQMLYRLHNATRSIDLKIIALEITVTMFDRANRANGK